MDWRIIFNLKGRGKEIKRTDVESIRYYGKTKEDVKLLLRRYRCESSDGMLHFTLFKTWYGKKRTLCFVFKQNKVEEKYVKTEYGKLSITKLYKNLS